MSNSESKNPKHQPPAHLQKLYDAREQRTVHIVNESVDALFKGNKPISLKTIVAKSKEIDPEGKGVSITAIQRNAEANAYYQKYRTHKNSPSKPSYIAVKKLPQIDVKKIKFDRDLSQVRQRYLKLTKEELVDRLIAIEQGLAEQEDNWHSANDELFSQLLEVESENLQETGQDLAALKLQDLTNQIKQLREKNKHLKAQLAGMEGLDADKKQLESENQRLFNKVLQLESSKRSQDAKSFVSSRKRVTKQPDIPDIEY